MARENERDTCRYWSEVFRSRRSQRSSRCTRGSARSESTRHGSRSHDVIGGDGYRKKGIGYRRDPLAVAMLVTLETRKVRLDDGKCAHVLRNDLCHWDRDDRGAFRLRFRAFDRGRKREVGESAERDEEEVVHHLEPAVTSLARLKRRKGRHRRQSRTHRGGGRRSLLLRLCDRQSKSIQRRSDELRAPTRRACMMRPRSPYTQAFLQERDALGPSAACDLRSTSLPCGAIRSPESTRVGVVSRLRRSI